MKAALICFALAAGQAAADAPTTGLDGFHAEYEASYAVFSGELIVDLRAGDKPGEYVYEVSTRTRGLAKAFRSGTAVETSRFRLAGEEVIPLQYSLDDGTPEPENDMNIEFDWESGVAHSVYKEEKKDVPITDGVLDRQTTDVQSIIELRAGRQPGRYEIVYKNGLRDEELTYLGSEEIRVPAGTFQTVKYKRQRPGSTRNTLIWFAADYDYIPVRVEQQKRGKSVIKMVATQVKSDARD